MFVFCFFHFYMECITSPTSQQSHGLTYPSEQLNFQTSLKNLSGNRNTKEILSKTERIPLGEVELPLRVKKGKLVALQHNLFYPSTNLKSYFGNILNGGFAGWQRKMLEAKLQNAFGSCFSIVYGIDRFCVVP